MALRFLCCIDTLNVVLGVFASSAGDKSLVVHSEQLHLWANKTLLRVERMLKSLSSTSTLHGTKLPPPLSPLNISPPPAPHDRAAMEQTAQRSLCE